jgi:hypothetical protein
MEDREKLIQKKIKSEEETEMIKLEGVKQIVWEILIADKKFNIDEISIEPNFRIKLTECEATVSIDFLITIGSDSFMVIKCSSSAIESWERYITAFARAVKDYQIPYAMVTDGKNAKIINVIKGTSAGESINNLFTRDQAIEIMKNFQKIPCPENRCEKEKRIIYAFEGIKCPSVK